MHVRKRRRPSRRQGGGPRTSGSGWPALVDGWAVLAGVGSWAGETPAGRELGGRKWGHCGEATCTDKYSRRFSTHLPTSKTFPSDSRLASLQPTPTLPSSQCLPCAPSPSSRPPPPSALPSR